MFARKHSYTGSIALLAALLMVSSAVSGAELPDFTTLVKQNGAAVVNIRVTQKVKKTHATPPSAPIPGVPEDSPFNEFFRHFFENRSGMSPPTQSIGSGFIISADGYILTNAHVVKDADELTVHLSDQRELPAKLLGMDERTDVALLKVDAEDLPTVTIGDSDELSVGQWVVAIGSPFGLEHTATQGIISALGRNLPNETYVPFIQTDVAVNPGNSGGPLFDTHGEVIGVNSQIYSNTGAYVGLSFAIPINIAMQVSEQIKEHGYVHHGWLGVYIQPVTQELAESFGLERPRGALVAKVQPDSPAAEAGIKTGDIITRFDGKLVERSSDLPGIVGAMHSGQEVKVDVLRNRDTKTLRVEIGTLPETAAAVPYTGKEVYPLHMAVAELNDAQRKELDVPEHGVLVTDVEDGPASDAGIREGDVLLMLGHKRIDHVADIVEQAKELPPGKPVSVLVQRDKSPLFIALRVAKG